MARSDYLFAEGDLSAVLRAEQEKIGPAAQRIPADHVLGRSVDELAAELADERHVEPLVIHWEQMTASYVDAEVSVQGWNRMISVPGTTVTYHIPFEGDPVLLRTRPSTFSSVFPVAFVSGSEIRVSTTVRAPIPESLGGQLDAEIKRIKQYAGWVNAEVETYNAGLLSAARVAVVARRDKVLADQHVAASLGVPLRKREDAAPTYAAPAVRRKIARPAQPPPAAVPREPEPVLLPEDYEHILGVVRGMAHVLERSPTAFSGMGEESIRQHFLVQLNGHYEGQATGETFNFGGKTDILVRERDRNVFVAECKFWGGAKVLTETIDQLLGYLSWRDTKTAIFIFNRNRDLTKVLEQISPTVSAHDCFVREIPYGTETEFRFVMHQHADRARELTLTVLVFDVPA